MAAKLKILVINWQDISNPLSGGAEIHLQEIFKRLVQMGHQVSLLCSRYSGCQIHAELDGIQIVRQGQRNTFNFIVPRAYARLALKNRYDIVVDDLNKIPFYTPLYVQAPILAICHHLFGKSIFMETAIPGASYVYLSERLIAPVYRRTPFACVSPSTRNELAALGLKGALKLVYNGVELPQFGTGTFLKSKKPLIGYLGRIKKYKCIDHFLRALPAVCRQVPDLRVVVIGEGDHRLELMNLADRLGIATRVEFTGAVSTEVKIQRLQEMWLAVNPSPKEGWGLTVIEANACGTPVVAADAPGLRDSVLHQKTGWLYPHGDIPALTEALTLLLRQSDLRHRLALAARAWSEKFTWDESANSMNEFIHEIIDQHRAGGSE